MYHSSMQGKVQRFAQRLVQSGSNLLDSFLYQLIGVSLLKRLVDKMIYFSNKSISNAVGMLEMLLKFLQN